LTVPVEAPTRRIIIRPNYARTPEIGVIRVPVGIRIERVIISKTVCWLMKSSEATAIIVLILIIPLTIIIVV
jgi:hypothetical protein